MGSSVIFLSLLANLEPPLQSDKSCPCCWPWPLKAHLQAFLLSFPLILRPHPSATACLPPAARNGPWVVPEKLLSHPVIIILWGLQDRSLHLKEARWPFLGAWSPRQRQGNSQAESWSGERTWEPPSGSISPGPRENPESALSCPFLVPLGSTRHLCILMKKDSVMLSHLKLVSVTEDQKELTSATSSPPAVMEY